MLEQIFCFVGFHDFEQKNRVLSQETRYAPQLLLSSEKIEMVPYYQVVVTLTYKCKRSGCIVEKSVTKDI